MRGDTQYPYTEWPDARFVVSAVRRGWLVIDAHTSAVLETHTSEYEAEAAAERLNKKSARLATE